MSYKILSSESGVWVNVDCMNLKFTDDIDDRCIYYQPTKKCVMVQIVEKLMTQLQYSLQVYVQFGVK